MYLIRKAWLVPILGGWATTTTAIEWRRCNGVKVKCNINVTNNVLQCPSNANLHPTPPPPHNIIQYSFVPFFSFAVVKDCIPYPIHAVDRLVLTPQHINVVLTAVYDEKAVVSIVTWSLPLAVRPWSRPLMTWIWKGPTNQRNWLLLIAIRSRVK